eukprot:6468159-Amphidinium_carterae.9
MQNLRSAGKYLKQFQDHSAPSTAFESKAYHPKNLKWFLMLVVLSGCIAVLNPWKDDHAKKVLQPAQKQRNTRGGGGLWRAWVRYHSLGQSGRPNLGALGASYRHARSAQSPLLLQLQQIARAATESAKLRHSRKSAFGLRKRDEERATKRFRRVNLWRGAVGDNKFAKSKQLADSLPWETPLGDAICAARTFQLLDGAHKRAQRTKHLETIKKFTQTTGQTQLKLLVETLPECKLLQSNVQVLPGEIGPIFYIPATASDLATHAVALALESRSTNLSTSLEASWRGAHEPLQGVPTLAAAEPSSKCCAAGMCLCKGTGAKTWRLRQRFVKFMKETFKGTSMRQLLGSGFVVAHFKCREPCNTHTNDSKDWYMQVGHMYFSPYAPTMHVMVEEPWSSMPGAEHPHKILLKAQNNNLPHSTSE